MNIRKEEKFLAFLLGVMIAFFLAAIGYLYNDRAFEAVTVFVIGFGILLYGHRRLNKYLDRVRSIMRGDGDPGNPNWKEELKNGN